MNTNLPLSYMNIFLNLLFIVFLAQPEYTLLLNMCMSVIGSIVGEFYYERWKNKKYSTITNILVHWVPLFLSLALVNFSSITVRHLSFALLFPLLYLSMTFYIDSKGWTQFKLVNPITHLKEMYPGIDSNLFIIYYIIIVVVFVYSKILGIKHF